MNRCPRASAGGFGRLLPKIESAGRRGAFFSAFDPILQIIQATDRKVEVLLMRHGSQQSPWGQAALRSISLFPCLPR